MTSSCVALDEVREERLPLDERFLATEPSSMMAATPGADALALSPGIWGHPAPTAPEAPSPLPVTAATPATEAPMTERDLLFQDFQPLVRRLIRQYGEDPEMRQDLAGEIYCRFCHLLDAYDPSRGIPLRAYMVRTLTASVYTFSRSQWRRQHREVSLEATTTVHEPVDPVDPSRQWDRDLMTQEVLKSLPAAIAELPARQRQVVIWRYYESRSFEEIAETLKVRPATARSLLRHGLNNLRKRISPSGLTE